MTKLELQKRIEAGDCLIVAEYRRGVAETLKWRDKATRQAMSGPTIRHTVETATKSISVNERPDDGFVVDTFKQPLAKGSPCVVIVTMYQMQAGAVSVRGTVEPLT